MTFATGLQAFDALFNGFDAGVSAIAARRREAALVDWYDQLAERQSRAHNRLAAEYQALARDYHALSRELDETRTRLDNCAHYNAVAIRRLTARLRAAGLG